MLKPLNEYIARNPRIVEARRVGVAISGGGDSVALARLAASAGLPIILLHMNYGLRGAESDGDVAFVIALGSELGCEVLVERVAPEGKSEDVLRRLRYEWFANCNVDVILTGHTRDDQAETVLFRVLRGTGPTGLVGIVESYGNRIFRPLLRVSRKEVREWLASGGYVWREDSSNEALDYRRNWLRRVLLPQVREELNPQVDSALVGLAEIAGDEEAWLAGIVDQVFDNLVSAEADWLVLDCAQFGKLPVALQRRMMRRMMERVKGNLQAIDFAHVEAAVRLALDGEGNGRIQIPGLDLMRSFGWLRVIRMQSLLDRSPRNFRFLLDAPSAILLPDGAGVVRSTLDTGNLYNESGSLDWGKLCAAVDLESPLELRNWRPGDFYRRSGTAQPEKVKDLFQKYRVPLWRRRTWPIIVLRDSPVWVAEFGPAEEFAAKSDAQTRLCLEWVPAQWVPALGA